MNFICKVCKKITDEKETIQMSEADFKMSALTKMGMGEFVEVSPLDYQAVVHVCVNCFER